MVLKNTYFEKWYRTANEVILRPGKFFREMPAYDFSLEYEKFAAVVILFQALICVPVLMIMLFPEPLNNWLLSPVFDSEVLFIILAIAITIAFFSLISLYLYAGIYHILLKICKAKGDFEATFRVICYYYAALLIPTVSALLSFELIYLNESGINNFGFNTLLVLSVLILLGAVIYSFYVLFKGFCAVHSMSMNQVVLSVIGIPFGLYLLMVGFTSGLGVMQEFGDWYGNHFPGTSKITAPYGTAPIIDGYITDEDRWDETGQIDFTSAGKDYTIAAKHDYSTLYILIKMEAGPGWHYSQEIYFEQDEDAHDHNLMTGLNDKKYNGYPVFGPNSFIDDHIPYEEYIAEPRNGMVRGNYTDGFWIQEWVVPLQSNDPEDILIKQFPSTLGFAIFPGLGGEVTWPANAYQILPATWGDMVLLPRKGPVEEPPTLIASAGTEPVVDGFYTSEDGWNDADQIAYSARGIDYTLAAKHDYRYLYVLRMWKGGTGMEGLNGMYLEQDGSSHDHNLTTGKNLEWVISATPYELQHPEMLQPDLKLSKDGGYTALEKSNDLWVQELVIPLQRDKADHLYVDQFPVTLGFAFIPPVWEGGATWPAGAWRYDPESWGHLVLLP